MYFEAYTYKKEFEPFSIRYSQFLSKEYLSIFPVMSYKGMASIFGGFVFVVIAPSVLTAIE
jgi:hypothetical protein